MIKETILKKLGYRKCGAIDVPDDRDWIYSELVKSTPITNDIGDLSIYHQDQGNTPACTAYALAHCINIEIRKQSKHHPDVRGDDLWKKQQEDANSSLQDGDSLQHALSCAARYKVLDHVTGIRYGIKYWRVLKTDVLRVLQEDNATIYTGLLADYPMCDKNWFWKNTKKGGGHALCAFDGRIGVWGKGLNSWKKWGFKNTGVWNWYAQDTNSMFSFYAIRVVPQSQ
jgi:hypothetical protein